MWDRKRREEFVVLRDLVWDLAQLDQSSGAVTRLPELVTAAKVLQEPGGLVDFLYSECFDEGGAR